MHGMIDLKRSGYRSSARNPDLGSEASVGATFSSDIRVRLETWRDLSKAIQPCLHPPACICRCLRKVVQPRMPASLKQPRASPSAAQLVDESCARVRYGSVLGALRNDVGAVAVAQRNGTRRPRQDTDPRHRTSDGDISAHRPHARHRRSVR